MWSKAVNLDGDDEMGHLGGSPVRRVETDSKSRVEESLSASRVLSHFRPCAQKELPNILSAFAKSSLLTFSSSFCCGQLSPRKLLLTKPKSLHYHAVGFPHCMSLTPSALYPVCLLVPQAKNRPRSKKICCAMKKFAQSLDAPGGILYQIDDADTAEKTPLLDARHQVHQPPCF